MDLQKIVWYEETGRFIDEQGYIMNPNFIGDPLNIERHTKEEINEIIVEELKKLSDEKTNPQSYFSYKKVNSYVLGKIKSFENKHKEIRYIAPLHFCHVEI